MSSTTPLTTDRAYIFKLVLYGICSCLTAYNVYTVFLTWCNIYKHTSYNRDWDICYEFYLYDLAKKSLANYCIIGLYKCSRPT